MLQTIQVSKWDEIISSSIQEEAIEDLERGGVIYLPELDFSLLPEEKIFLTDQFADPNYKNIGYNSLQNQLWGVQRLSDEQRIKLKLLLKRYAQSAVKFLQNLFPAYAEHLEIGRTSFRPVQISGRKTSYRKDDRRLHVDAFPSAPNQGKRILRIFTNINPHGEDRVWRIGEPFEKVANQFLHRIHKPFPGKGLMLRFLKITKKIRTQYDHYMLHLHDLMKADENYQKNAQQNEVRFMAGSSWVVQTDHVSHAAMQGQHVLEQTFYLPVRAMKNPSRSPLKILESMLQKKLA